MSHNYLLSDIFGLSQGQNRLVRGNYRIKKMSHNWEDQEGWPQNGAQIGLLGEPAFPAVNFLSKFK